MHRRNLIELPVEFDTTNAGQQSLIFGLFGRRIGLASTFHNVCHEVLRSVARLVKDGRRGDG